MKGPLTTVSVSLVAVFLCPLFLSGPAPGRYGSITSDQIISRLAAVDSFAFGGVGLVLATSQGEADYRTILSRPSAGVDFERLFVAGNVQAKCYALVGLRQVDPRRFESLAAISRSSGKQVSVTSGCVMSERSMAGIINQIRAGAYSGPMTRGLIPAPTVPGTPASHEEGWITRVLRVLSPAPSPVPDPPPPPPAPPPPPGWRYSK